MWDAVITVGAGFGLMPYGTEAMSTLRIEKGHVVIGPEADGRTTADDLGLGGLVNAGKWCVGKPLLGRSALVAPDRWQLVGLTAVGGATMPRAAKLVADPDHPLPNPMLGHVTSWFQPDRRGSRSRCSRTARGTARRWAVSPLADTRCRFASGLAFDPAGERLRA
jgi:sarcosine oxidase subunit alpha